MTKLCNELEYLVAEVKKYISIRYNYSRDFSFLKLIKTCNIPLIGVLEVGSTFLMLFISYYYNNV